MPQFHHIFLLLVTDSKCGISTKTHAECLMPPRHRVQAKAYDPNRFNVVFHCMFFCIRNKQALVQKRAAETGTAALRKAAKGLTWRRS